MSAMHDPLPWQDILTERCRLRRFRPGDIDAFVGYRSDPQVAALQSWDAGFGRGDAERFLHDLAATPFGEAGTWSQIAVAARDASDALLGDCALHFLDDEQVELGFTFAREHQGRGLAGEAVRALLGQLFGAWQRHRVVAIVDTRNGPAAALLRRLGWRQEAHFVKHSRFKGDWCDEFQFGLLRSEWLSMTRG